MSDARSEGIARLKVLVGFRFLLVATSGGLVALLAPSAMAPSPPPAVGPPWSPFGIRPLWVLAGVVVANLGTLALLRRVRRAKPLAALGHLGDVLAATLLVGGTGGTDSPLTFLYFAPLVSSSLFFAGRWSVLLASVSTVGLSGMELFRAMSTREIQGLGGSLPSFAPNLFAQGFAFHLVAYLSGTLAASLKRARLLNRGVLDTIHEGVLTLDREGRIAFVNSPARELLGLPAGEPLAGRAASEVFAEARHAVLRSVLLDGPGRRQETLLLSPAGRRVPISIRTSVLADEDGRVSGVVALIGNRTVYKRMLDAVQAAERLRAISELGAGIAHEIRNPLASVRGAIQELQGRPGASEDETRLMEIILRESDRLDRIITEFLNFARTSRPRSVDVNLRELLGDVAVLLEKSPPGAGGAIRLELADPLSCRGDPDQMKQVFLNLGLNALEASHGRAPVVIRAFQSRLQGPIEFPDGGGEVPLDERDRWGATVEVADRGDGIDPKILDRILAPFFTTKPQGTGMGLAIASRIIREHGGSLEVETAPGQGSTFRVWIPAGFDEGEGDAPKTAAEARIQP